MTVVAARLRDDFDGLYQANFGETVAMAYGFTEFEGITGAAASWPKASIRTPEGIVIGDLTGDRLAEAALIVSCMASADSELATTNQLLVVTRNDDGTMRALAWVGRSEAVNMLAWIRSGVLYADTQPTPGAGRNWNYRFGAVDGWRWQGSAFDLVDVDAQYPRIIPGALDLTAVTAKLRQCGNLPQREETPTFNEDRVAQDGDREWALNPDHPAGVIVTEPLWVELDRPGRPYFLVTIGCRPAGSGAAYDTSLVLFDPAGGKAAKANAAASDGTSAALEITRVSGTEIDVSLGQTAAKFRWTGTELQRVN